MMFRAAFVSVFALLAAQAQASTILLERQFDFGQEFKELRFRLDNVKPSAELEVDIDKYVETGFDQPAYIGLKTFWFQPKGLEYQVDDLLVTYAGERGPVICATIELLRRRYIAVHPTGKCRVFGERRQERLFEDAPPTFYYDVYFETLE